MKAKRPISRYAAQAVVLLGQHIRAGRIAKRQSEAEFAARVRISRTTLQKVERGDPGCEIGIVFEAAALAGVALFQQENGREPFAAALEEQRAKLALLPKRTRKPTKVKDEF